MLQQPKPIFMTTTMHWPGGMPTCADFPAASAFLLAQTRPRPVGRLSAFWLPVTATSTRLVAGSNQVRQYRAERTIKSQTNCLLPHQSSNLNGRAPMDDTPSTISSAG